MIEMKFIKLIIVFLIFALIAPISFALESSMNESTALKNDSAPVENQTISRFYIDRSNFETNIIYRMPAPQEYANELPPIGVKEITYDSGNLRLKA